MSGSTSLSGRAVDAGNPVAVSRVVSQDVGAYQREVEIAGSRSVGIERRPIALPLHR